MNRADEALLEAWCAGELRAFDLLYARFEGPHGFCGPCELLVAAGTR